ncbi:MAG: OmpA family protein [Bacteroidia bacterium]
MKKNSVFLILMISVMYSCVSSSKYSEAQARIEKLKADSALLAKRNRMLTEEKTYLETKGASMEQLLTNRLQEKQDSLSKKEELLQQREMSINDMKARKAEEREAFETLSKSVFELFSGFNPNEVFHYTNCTQINVVVSDRMLFSNGNLKLDPKSATVLSKVAEAFSKNADLRLVVTGHTDSLNLVKEKYDDNWTLGMMKANIILRSLLRDYKISPVKISSSSKAETVTLPRASGSIGRNRIEFVFYSSFLPCIHSKE